MRGHSEELARKFRAFSPVLRITAIVDAQDVNATFGYTVQIQSAHTFLAAMSCRYRLVRDEP